MTIRRSVPDITTSDPAASSAFYQLLGFREEMNLGWVVNLVSPSNPTAQVILITKDAAAPVNPDLSVEVEDVDAVYEAVRATGAEIVHPITDEDWGVRRFFARDPDGKVVNVVSHQS
ncbi:VOC family protein [Nonomuraea sp. NPDC049649]|uniref:VOC family protein n=1 Tax=Nonomuraea sp. NPDC049649 TaxID=3155776 RepID=UPI0034407382